MTITLARVVQTCAALPSQWDAWTVDGQYLYLRYRSGTGTVDAYDTEDSEQWTRIPDGAVARFDTGDRTDGEMDLPEFCQRAGLRLADGVSAEERVEPGGCPCGHPLGGYYMCLNGRIYGPCSDENCGGVCDDTHGTCTSDDCACEEIS